MIKKDRILSDFLELASIDSPSYGEREITDVLKKKLGDLGFLVKEDRAAEKIGGNAGNLYAYLPGTLSAQILPLWASTILRAMARPRPLPVISLLWEVSSR